MDLSTKFSLSFLLIIGTWSQRITCCVDFDPTCDLIAELRNTDVINFPSHKIDLLENHIFKPKVILDFFQATLADINCDYGIKDYCPVACNNCQPNGKKFANVIK